MKEITAYILLFVASIIALGMTLQARAADSCETRAKFAYLSAEHAHRLSLPVIVQGLQAQVTAHPEQWTTLDIQMALRAIVFGYGYPKQPEIARELELRQCEKEREI